MTARLHRAYREEVVQTVAFAGDSDRVMIATGDQVEVFALPRGEHLFHFDDEHEGVIASVALSRDGRRALYGSALGRLVGIDLETGRVTVLREGDSAGAVTSIALTGDGRHGVALVRLDEGCEELVFFGPDSALRTERRGGTDGLSVWLDDDDQVVLLTTSRALLLLGRFGGPTAEPRPLYDMVGANVRSYEPSLGMCVVSRDSNVVLVDVRTGRRTMLETKNVESANWVFAKHRDELLSVTVTGARTRRGAPVHELVRFDRATGRALGRAEVDGDSGVFVDPSTLRVVAGQRDGRVDVYDLLAHRHLATVWPASEGVARTVAIAEDGTPLLARAGREGIWLYRVDGTRGELLEGSSGARVRQIVFSRDATVLAAVVWPGLVKRWRTEDRVPFGSVRIVGPDEVRTGGLPRIALSPDGAHFAVLSMDLPVYEAHGRRAGRFVTGAGPSIAPASRVPGASIGPGASDDAEAARVSWLGPDARRLVAYHRARGALVLFSRGESGEMEPPTSLVANAVGAAVAIDHAFTRVAIAHEPAVRVVDLASGESRSFVGHPNKPRRLLFSPDGRWLAASDAACDAVTVWSTETGEIVRRIAIQARYESPFAIADDGQTLHLESTDGAVLRSEWDGVLHRTPLAYFALPRGGYFASGGERSVLVGGAGGFFGVAEGGRVVPFDAVPHEAGLPVLPLFRPRALPPVGGASRSREAIVREMQLAEAEGRTCELGQWAQGNVDLSGLDLGGVSLSGASLVGANLRKCDLRGADLDDAVLEDADLTGAHLEGASLVRTRLARATLDGASLEDARICWADVAPRALEKAFGLLRFEPKEELLVERVALDPRGDTLVVLVQRDGAPSHVHAFDVPTGTQRWCAETPGGEHLVVSADGSKLFVDGAVLSLVDLRSGAVLARHEQRGAASPARWPCMISPDGRFVARLAPGRDGVVVLDAETMDTSFEVALPRSVTRTERAVVHAWGATRLAIFERDLLVIDVGAPAPSTPVKRFDAPTLVAMSFRADGHLVALDAAGRVLLFDRDFSAFSRRGRLDPADPPILHPSFAKDGAVVFSCHRSPELRSTAYDDVPMEPFVTCELVSPAPPHHAALAEDCSLVASTDQTVARVWRVDRTRGTILPSRTFYPLPDGEWLSLGDDGTWVASSRAGDLVQVTSPAFPGFRSLGDAVAAQGRRARLVWR